MPKPSSKALGKRKAAAPPSKTSKKSRPSRPGKSSSHRETELGPTGKPKRGPDQPKKVKLRDQKIIPVPMSGFENDEGSEDGLMDLGEEEGLEVGGSASAFLKGLDRNALSRSTKETQRLHQLSKEGEQMPKKRKQKVRLPSPGSASTMSDYDINSEDDLDFGSDEELGEGSGASAEDDSDGEEGSGGSSEDQVEFNAAYDEEELDEMFDEEDEEEEAPRRRKTKGRSADEEAEYELAGRTRWTPKPPKPEEDSVEVGRLPIKLPTGEVQMVEGSTRIALPQGKKKKQAEPPSDEDEEDEEEEEEEGSDDGRQAEQMAGQKGKFGRMGVAEIVGTPGWKNAQRLVAAKEQIALIGAEILGGGELMDNGPLLTRLSTFALPTVPSLEEGRPPLPVPASIRGIAFLSQLAVYKDLIPGYRIRQLTALEEGEKVRDEVRRLREGEKMLVRSYKGYLKTLEGEIKRRSPLATLSIKCMCDLLSSVTHFNFSENIMGVLVGRLGRKSWDEDSDLVLQTFIDVFRNDLTAVPSQTLVRLIARMIKERRFQVHPNVLSCLLQLRLRGELDFMRQGKHKKGRGEGKGDGVKGQKFKSETRKKWATKNQRKKEKELKEVEKEMAEAEAEVDKEERAQVQTETLKNLFVLYFSILKHPGKSPLLAAALEGISHFAHLINIDFFRDLLAVLRKIIVEQDDRPDEEEEGEEEVVKVEVIGSGERARLRLLAIVTAFELLSGQGEALNIDLGDFINALFALLRPLSLDTSIEDPPYTTSSTISSTSSIPHSRPLIIGRGPVKLAVQTQATSSLLFRSLHAIFFSRHSHSTAPPYRTAAFAKRLAECALLFPPTTARQSLEFVRSLMAREAKLEGMLDTEERMFDGVYKPEMEDPQLVNPFATSLWEADVLAVRHWDKGVRGEAAKLRDGTTVTNPQRA